MMLIVVWLSVVISCLSAASSAVTLHKTYNNKTEPPGTVRCHDKLSRLWAAVHRHPCGARMLNALDALEAVAPVCRRLSWGSEFEGGRGELHEHIIHLCGQSAISDGDAPVGAEKLVAAENKLEHLAEAEDRKLNSKNYHGSEVIGVTEAELDASSKRIADGEVEGPKDLEAMQEVMDAENLSDVSRKAVSGGTNLDSETVAEVVTVEDLRVVTAEALGDQPDEMNLQESPTDLSGTSKHIIVQGDMRVPRPNAASLAQLRKDKGGSGKLEKGDFPKVAAGETWPGGMVPYCFEIGISSEARRAFMEAVQHIAGTQVAQCISFEEIPVAADGKACSKAPSLFMQSSEPRTCWSDVGYIPSGNAVNLGSGCEVKGIAIHEIGHTLGMDHEQSRPDRDQFVQIHFDSIMPGFESQFDINPQAYVSEPYDYLSIMHYGAFTFSKERASLPTITTVQGKASSALGQAMGLSETDVKQLGDMYCPTMTWVGDMHASLAESRDSMIATVGQATGMRSDSRSFGTLLSNVVLVASVLVFVMNW